MMGASAAHMTATEVPACFRCPISLDIMRDPVSLCTGVTYERSCIERWLSQGHRTCPATKEPLLTLELIPNHTLRRLIQHWCASLLFSEVPSSRSAAAHTLRKLRLKSCKSDTHRNILNDSRFISLLIRILLSDEGDDAADAAESEAAGLLALALAETHMHIERDGHAHKKQAEALRGPRLVPCLDRLLRRGDRNAVSLIEVLSRDRIFARMLSHLLEPLLHMLAAAAGTFTSASPYEPSLRRDEQSRRENIASHRAAGTPAHEEELSARAGVGVSLRWQQGPSLKEDDAWATQQEEEEEEEEDEEEREDEDEEAWRTAAVGAVQNMCRVGRGVRVRVAEAGGVRAVTEVLNWSESALLKTKCLGVLESVSATAEGRAAIDDHTLCVPAVVRCVPRVSDEANEYAVGFLWQMFVKCADNDLVLNRSLLEMAMKKLLVLVQIDSCSPSTKLKANHLLKRFSSCLPTRSTTSH